MQEIIDICVFLAKNNNDINWERIDNKNAYTATVLLDLGMYVTLFRSYNTIVGLITDDTLYEFTRFSSTTSRQLSSYFRESPLLYHCKTEVPDSIKSMLEIK